jgi:hypothetical protein
MCPGGNRQDVAMTEWGEGLQSMTVRKGLAEEE